MFSFFKDKLKGALDSIKKKFDSGEKKPAEEPTPDKEEMGKKDIGEKEAEEKPQKKKPSASEKKESGHIAVVPEHTAEVRPEQEIVPPEKIAEEKEAVEKEEKKGFFARLTEKISAKKIADHDFEELFKELERILLESNVALEVVEAIKGGMKEGLVGKEVRRGKIADFLKEELRKSIVTVLDVEKINLEELVRSCRQEKRPCVLVVLGYNGSGKSLSCVRMAAWFKRKGISVLLAAGDTFRSAGVEQLVQYGSAVKVPVVRQAQGADSCSVIYDAVSKAKAKGIDVVIADTAGRMHTSKDLMRELQKIIKVNRPDLKILVLDSLMGTDVVEQVRSFESMVGVDALIFTKVDVYDKGGALLSAASVGKKPILFLGTGQGYENFQLYDRDKLLESFGL